MPDYFLSDVHLRFDRLDRGRRLANLVDQLGPGDPLVVVGDLVDFWFASRQRDRDPMTCPGLRALASYRDRGGQLTILAGNHDSLMRDYYRTAVGGTWVNDSLRVESHGLRLHLSHGHRLGTRSVWKAAMEGRAFYHAFRSLPLSLAGILDTALGRTNEAHRDEADRRHLAIFRRAADRLAGEVDAVVLGHVHVAIDDREGTPRLIVLGGWHERASYLRVDESGAQLVVEPEG